MTLNIFALTVETEISVHMPGGTLKRSEVPCLEELCLEELRKAKREVPGGTLLEFRKVLQRRLDLDTTNARANSITAFGLGL